MEERRCDCYETEGSPDPDCRHPTRKREAYVDELTDAQLKFLFYSQQEREKLKKEKAESNSGGNSIPTNVPKTP